MISVLQLLGVTIFVLVTSTAVTINTTISLEEINEGVDLPAIAITSVLSSKQIIAAANEPAIANLFGSSTERDFFLFSGQSNAIGHTTSSQSITKNVTYWMYLLRLFNEAEHNGGTSDVWNDKLYNTIQSVHTAADGPASVITLLRDEVVKLQGLGLLNRLNQSLSTGYCSFIDFVDFISATQINRSGGSKSTIWSANCGESFGHELMFSKTLEMNKTVPRSFETVKIAKGGSTLYTGWYPGSGVYWETLKNSVQSRKGAGQNWRAFVWAQGEQARVRAEMFAASETLTWRCLEEIPVIISMVGYWPDKNEAKFIRNAQQTYCDSDVRSVCVSMNDTSRFYHYDATSFLIGGHRIANAYLGLKSTQMNFTCPPPTTRTPSTPPAPTKFPTTKRPTKNPTKNPTKRPTKIPTKRPRR